MIAQTYPSKRQTIIGKILSPQAQPNNGQKFPTAVRPDASDRERAARFQISGEEFVRRDNIVRELYLSCPYRINSVVRPKTDVSWNLYGYLTVKDIFKSYHDFPLVEAKSWPDDDVPYTITCSATKGSDLLVVTADFLQSASGATC